MKCLWLIENTPMYIKKDKTQLLLNNHFIDKMTLLTKYDNVLFLVHSHTHTQK